MDASWYRMINRFAARTGWLHWLFADFARDGIVLFAVALLVAWWLARRTGDLAQQAGVAWAGLAPLVALGAGQLIGRVVDRPRPYAAMPAAHVLLARTTDVSFPSDHATVAGAVAAGLVVAGVAPWLARSVLVAAVVMAFSRVYAGVHYPGDVLAGLLLGAIVAVALRRPSLALLRPVTRALAATPLRPLLLARGADPSVGGEVAARA